MNLKKRMVPILLLGLVSSAHGMYSNRSSYGSGDPKPSNEFEIKDKTLYSLAGAAALVVGLLSKRSTPVMIVKQAEAVVLERLGKYHNILTPGIHFKIPFVDVPRAVLGNHGSGTSINMQDIVETYPIQGVVTKDNVQLDVTAVVRHKVEDPAKTLYSVVNLTDALEAKIQASVRSKIGTMVMDDVFGSKPTINSEAMDEVQGVASHWGTSLKSVDIQDVILPDSIHEAMQQEMEAERQKIAAIKKAEAAKLSQELAANAARYTSIQHAEGAAESARLNAQGEADATRLRAEAEADAIRMRADAEAEALKRIGLSTAEPANYVLMKEYIGEIGNLASGNGNAIVIPSDGTPYANIATLLNTVNKVTK